MPTKHRSEAVRQHYTEAQAENARKRIEVVGDLIRKTAPMGEENATPKPVVFKQAVEHYKNNGEDLRKDPWFKNHKTSFINEGYMRNQWSDVVSYLSDCGVTVCIKIGRHGGIFLSGKKAHIEATFAHKDAIIKGSSEKRNYLAENANQKRYIALPILSLDFFLPAVSAAA